MEGVSPGEDEALLSTFLAGLRCEIARRDELLRQAALLDELHVVLATGHAAVLAGLLALHERNTRVQPRRRFLTDSTLSLQLASAPRNSQHAAQIPAPRLDTPLH